MSLLNTVLIKTLIDNLNDVWTFPCLVVMFVDAKLLLLKVFFIVRYKALNFWHRLMIDLCFSINC